MQKVEGATKVERLVKLLGDTTASELDVGGFSASQLAEEFSTPYYVYNGDVIVGQIQRLRQALGPETDIYYSLKANPSLGLCQLIARQDLGAEVASIGELLLAQKAGFPPDRTIFAGPGKTRQELELATRLGVKAVNVESEGELGRLGRIAESARHVTGVGIRVNPYLPVTGAQMRMGGGSQQFGIDEEALDTLLAQFNGHPCLQIRGLHVYVGTQIFDVDALVNHFHHVVDLSLTTADRLGRAVDMVDFGGGFGVPYFDGTEEFDLDRFAVLYRDVVARCKADSRLDSASLIVELGRYLVAEAGRLRNAGDRCQGFPREEVCGDRWRYESPHHGYGKLRAGVPETVSDSPSWPPRCGNPRARHPGWAMLHTPGHHRAERPIPACRSRRPGGDILQRRIWV